MDRSEFQRLLNQEVPATVECLPEDFAGEILAKGKLVRRLIRQDWKWLAGASLVSLLIAIAFGLGAGPSAPDHSRPPLLLFQSGADTAPFTSK